MRLHIAPIPDDAGFHPEEGDWRKLKEPSFGVLMLLALPTSVLIAFGFFPLGWRWPEYMG